MAQFCIFLPIDLLGLVGTPLEINPSISKNLPINLVCLSGLANILFRSLHSILR